ncbi:unnamed protein product [Bursaphelenchus okinawaensis]|uniref:Peptidase M13 C-terminal domain-containing protein n=1 Tax=Bursaphelenchus okinawaensis TaxID=465554 RepID=A0A811L683_9BILA|nr:unnamed protein product [Bursaphelenchus okinawaensis]CAG9118649.1 unnamed protein product [Bursaphelenchus okinawaensis]
MNKISNVQINIGWPEDLTDTIINQRYVDFILDDNRPFDEELENIKALQFKDGLKLLLNTKKNHKEFTDVLHSPTADYNVNTNSISIFETLLNQPMYDNNYPKAVNYGALGFIIGHELGHAFDSLGIDYDVDEDYNPWVNEETKSYFKKLYDCLVKQYGEYKVGERSLNSKSTLRENFADNLGNNPHIVPKKT